MVDHWSVLNAQKYKLVGSCHVSLMPSSGIEKDDMLERRNVLIRIFTYLVVCCAYPPLHATMRYEIDCWICGHLIIDTTPPAVFKEIEKWNKLYRRQKKKAQRSGVVVPAEDVEATTSTGQLWSTFYRASKFSQPMLSQIDKDFMMDL